MRVEAVRHALFEAAQKSTGEMDPTETREKLGQGILKAAAAVAIEPLPEAQLTKLPPAEASWSWLNFVVGGGVSVAPSDARRAMLALELTQMAQRLRIVDEAIEDPDRPAAEISAAARNRYLEAVLDHGQPSKPLRALLERVLARPAKPPVAAADRPVIKRKVKAPPTRPRRR
jgi:hypothetical protein